MFHKLNHTLKNIDMFKAPMEILMSRTEKHPAEGKKPKQSQSPKLGSA